MNAIARIEARIGALEALAAIGPGKHLDGMLAGLRLARADLLEDGQDARPRIGGDPLSESCRAHLMQGPATPPVPQFDPVDFLKASLGLVETPPPPPARFEAAPEAPGPVSAPAAPAAAPRITATPAPPKRPHWTATETPEARAARVAKFKQNRWGHPGVPAAEAVPAASVLPAGHDETAMAAAIAKAGAKHERAKALLRDGENEHLVASSVGLPLREVYRLKAQLREEGRSA